MGIILICVTEKPTVKTVGYESWSLHHRDMCFDRNYYALTATADQPRSAARGEMAARKLIVFNRQDSMGNAPAYRLFEAVTVTRVNGDKDTPARAFTDYSVLVDKSSVPEGVDVQELL